LKGLRATSGGLVCFVAACWPYCVGELFMIQAGQWTDNDSVVEAMVT